MKKKVFIKEVEGAVALASFSLRKDVLRLLSKAYRVEKSKLAKKALGWILDNAKIAKRDSLAICQDTGLPLAFIEVGKNIKLDSGLINCLRKGIIQGYRKNYLRRSCVDPLERKKSSYDGFIYHIDFNSKIKGLKIDLMPKGFGCENKTRLKMFNPTVGLDKIEDFIIRTIEDAGAEACPPFCVGVGIGGTSDQALVLAKRSLLKRLDKPNSDKKLQKLEQRLLTRINNLNIGPMGLGGRTTCLAVRIEKDQTHIAGLPVGVNINCHALRSATIKL